MQANNEKTFKCLNCGKVTTSKRNNIFCSNDCYLEYRKRPNQIIKKELYAELIIRSMRYGTKHIVIDLEDAEKCKNYKWFLSFDEILNSFYVKTSKYPYSLHRVIMDCPKGFVVDHINHNTLDNRKENLRICTHAENMQNRKRVRECVNCIDLKRQNEELKAKCKKYGEINEQETKDYAELKAELEQYKKSKQASYEQLQKRCNELELENRTLAREILKLNSAVDFITLTEHSAINKYNKLTQTLTEIKEIAENMNKECFYNDFDCKDCDIKNGCTYFNKKQILNKISEVLDNDNV